MKSRKIACSSATFQLENFSLANARLRTSPRFVGLCGRLGLIDYWRDTGHWPECVEHLTKLYDFKRQALDWRDRTATQ